MANGSPKDGGTQKGNFADEIKLCKTQAELDACRAKHGRA
jgi:hypothetical protein